MTRDARLSALHRGGFSPGAALPSPSASPPTMQGGHLPSGSVQRAPRSQVVVPGGRGPGPPEASGCEPPAAGRHSPLRLQDRLRRRPSMSEDGKLCSMTPICSQDINANRDRKTNAGKRHAFSALLGRKYAAATGRRRPSACEIVRVGHFLYLPLKPLLSK
jgi:hypothetical protein